MVKNATSMADIQNSQLLTAWFEQLTRQTDAQRCIHYMFRQKLEKIDFNYLTWHNMLRVYERYSSDERGTSFSGSSRESMDSFNGDSRDSLF